MKTFKEFADEMVAKYGFCNWQCEDAWNAAQAALREEWSQAIPRPVTEEDVEAARVFLADITTGDGMRSALRQLRKEVIQELVNRGHLSKTYQLYIDQCR